MIRPPFFYDGNSTGFFIRDLQLFLASAVRHQNFPHLLYCDERFEALIRSMSIGAKVIGYPARSPNEQYANFFDQLTDLIPQLTETEDIKTLPCGIQEPTGFLSNYSEDISSAKQYLMDLFDNSRTVLVIVSGLKPESDEGGSDLDTRRREGERQTYHFSEIAKVLQNAQSACKGTRIIPVSVQYGDPLFLKNHFAMVSAKTGLNPGIHHPMTVDWSNDFLAQARFMQAICEFNQHQGFPPLAVGNASTYAHMLLALQDWHSNNGKMFIAHDSFSGEVRVKNRAYWRELSQLQLGGVTVIPQDDETPGNWETVTERITALLIEEIRRHI